MSLANNPDTMHRYVGDIWMTRPQSPPDKTRLQGITVCARRGGEFFAVDYLQLDAEGVYYKNGKPLGRLNDDSMRRYAARLSGAGEDEQALYSRVREKYKAGAEMSAIARELGLSAERVRRILITAGDYTSSFTEQVAWLYDGGRGKTVAEIAGILGASEGRVRGHLPYK